MLELDEVVLFFPELDEDELLADEEFVTEEELCAEEEETFAAEESPTAELSLAVTDEPWEEEVPVMSVSEELLGVVIPDESESPQAAKNARNRTIEAKYIRLMKSMEFPPRRKYRIK